MQKRQYKKDQRDFVEKEKIEKYLTCPICQEIFDDPIRISCGHTFCKQCLLQWEKKSNNKLCSLCRNQYVTEYSGKDLTALSIINDSIVRCIYKGCPWKDKLSNLSNHIQTCLFEPHNLPDFMKKETKKNKKEVKDDEVEDVSTFNYTSSLKERLFARNPNLIQKVFNSEEKKKEKKENIENKNKLNRERILTNHNQNHSHINNNHNKNNADNLNSVKKINEILYNIILENNKVYNNLNNNMTNNISNNNNLNNNNILPSTQRNKNNSNKNSLNKNSMNKNSSKRKNESKKKNNSLQKNNNNNDIIKRNIQIQKILLGRKTERNN